MMAMAKLKLGNQLAVSLICVKLSSYVAIESRRITLPHQDPADRFLTATAAIYDLTLVTADARIIAAECVPILATG